MYKCALKDEFFSANSEINMCEKYVLGNKSPINGMFTRINSSKHSDLVFHAGH